MTDNEMKIAVAEALGWREMPIGGLWEKDGNYAIAEQKPDHSCLPDFPNDLNACAEMRKALTEDEKVLFAIRLKGALGIGLHETRHWKRAEFDLIDAPAKAQCVAFLKAKKDWRETAQEVAR